MTEEWREVIGYEGLYEVSSEGRLRNPTGRILKTYLHKSGYIYAALHRDRKMAFKRFHRLIGMAFIPNPDGYSDIDHIDRCRTNNTLTNLRWVSRSTNNLNKGSQLNSKTGEKNICPASGGFQFQFKYEGVAHRKWFKTLDEAKAYRLEVLGF